MYKRSFKRFFDLVFSLFLLPFIMIIIFIAGFLIKLDDKGPVFYVSERLGKNKNIYKMYKLRSMKVNAPDIRNEDGSTFNSINDPRLTKLGSFIRNTSLDELPQIINIVKGDMSFIGPRPDLPDAIKIYRNNEALKLTIRPGITGYNQAYFRNAATQEEKFENDLIYIEKVSFFLDIKIIIVTLKNIIKQKNINVSINKEG